MGKSNKLILDKFNLVRSTFFSLHSIGMKPFGLDIFLQAFLYKSFCLSKFLYGIENMSLSNLTLNNLNTMQNSLFRYLTRLSRSSHMSNLLNSLSILSISDLVMKLKVGFVNHLKNNVVTNEILNFLLTSKQLVNKRSKSFYSDIMKIGNLIDSSFDHLTFSKNFKIYLKNKLKSNGVSDSIKFCMHNIKLPWAQNLLKLLTKSF